VPNVSMDSNRRVRAAGGKEIGNADYDGKVRDGWHDRGKIENGRYIDEYGVDQGWVNRSSSSGGLGGNIGVILIFGVFYLMYLGIKWLVEQGKLSKAHASRSWGISSLFFAPFCFLALRRGREALNEIQVNGQASDQVKIAKTGIFFGYLVLGIWISAAIVSLFGL